MAGEYFGIRLDTNKLEQDAQQAKKVFDEIAEEAVEAGKTVDDSLGQGAQVAAGKFNALGFSIQQIARELPSLTISPQMFFLAISNNLPMFTDALANARKEFQAMTAAGQDAVPVWKQVAKSLLSYQTALSILPTLLILFSDEIGKFFESFVGGGKKIDVAKESIKAFKETMQKGELDAQKEITNLNLLYDATQDLSKSYNERKTAVDALQEQYPSYFKNISDEEIMAGKAADAYTRLSNSIIASAKARAAQDEMVNQQKIVLQNVTKINEAYARLEKAQSDYAGALQLQKNIGKQATPQEANFLAANVATSAKAVKDIENEIANYRTEVYKAEKITKELQSSINIEDLMFDAKGGEGKKQKAVDNLKQYLNELLGLQKDNEERQIELTKTGTEKQIALIELRYNRQIEAVKKLQEQLKSAQGGKLTGEQQGIFDTAISGLGTAKQVETTSITQKQIEDEKKAMQEYLIEYGDYWEKRKNLAAKYQDEIAKATTKGEKLSLQAEMTEALAKLDDEAQKKTSIITQLFGNMATKSVAEMRRIADEAEQLLSFIEGGEYQSGNAFGITEEQFKVLSQSPEKLESVKNEIQNVRNEADKAEPTFEKIKNLLQKIFNQGDSGNKLEEWLNELNGEVGKVMQSVSFLSNAFSSLGDAFGSEALSGISDGLNVAMGALDSAMQGAQAGAMFGPIGSAAGAALGMVSSLASSISEIHDKKNEENIQKLQEQIDALTNTYEKLGDAVEEAYSKDASRLIEQQNTLLEQQKVLIQGQIAEERDKKKTDESRIKEWEQQLEDINEQIEDNKEAAIDAIFGEDLQTAIDNFATSLTDAWAQGTNASKSARDVVRQMMQQMVTESIKAVLQSSKKMEEIRAKLQEFYTDNVLTGWEQNYIYNMADKLQEEINKQFGWAEDLFEEGNGTQTATSGVSASMSEDTGNEMNGRLTAMYESSLRQEQQIDIGNVNLEAIKISSMQTREIMQSCYVVLTDIRDNTGEIVEPIKKMQKDMSEMKTTLKNGLGR